PHCRGHSSPTRRSSDLPGTVYMAVVRSPYAHATIKSVDTTKAAAAEGVVAVFSGADLADDWKASLPTAWLPTEDTEARPSSRRRDRKSTRLNSSHRTIS